MATTSHSPSAGEEARHPFLMQAEPLPPKMLLCAAATCTWPHRDTCAGAGAAEQPLGHPEMVSNQNQGQIVRDELGAAQWKLH